MSSGTDNHRWFFPRATAQAQDGVFGYGPDVDGWVHTSLRVLELSPGEEAGGSCADDELVVVPLAGGCVVERRSGKTCDVVELTGRADVFAGATDVAYLPAAEGSTYAVRATETPVRVAVCGARSRGRRTDLSVRHVQADEVPVELRGAGRCSREVRNFATPDVLDAEAIIACEVLTPAGGWSSYPPHKHDEHRPGEETELEEIYYVETRDTFSGEVAPPGGRTSAGADPVGYQRVYGTPARPIDVLAEVRTGDVVLVPHGWHGPSVAAPDADLYYLNVMAGPGPERAWRICFDPSHDAVRASWEGQEVDPRLPFSGQARQGSY